MTVPPLGSGLYAQRFSGTVDPASGARERELVRIVVELAESFIRSASSHELR